MNEFTIPGEYFSDYDLSMESLMIIGCFMSGDLPSNDLSLGHEDLCVHKDAQYDISTRDLLESITNIIPISEVDVWKAFEELEEKKVIYFNFLDNQHRVECALEFDDDYLHLLQMNEREEDIKKLLKFFPLMELMDMTDYDDDGVLL